MDIKQAMNILYAVLAGNEYAKEQFAEALKVIHEDTEARQRANLAIDAYVEKQIAAMNVSLANDIAKAEMDEFVKRASKLEDKPGVPYPFCRHPEKCIHGRCEHDPVCND